MMRSSSSKTLELTIVDISSITEIKLQMGSCSSVERGRLFASILNKDSNRFHTFCCSCAQSMLIQFNFFFFNKPHEGLICKNRCLCFFYLFSQPVAFSWPVDGPYEF